MLLHATALSIKNHFTWLKKKKKKIISLAKSPGQAFAKQPERKTKSRVPSHGASHRSILVHPTRASPYRCKPRLRGFNPNPDHRHPRRRNTQALAATSLAGSSEERDLSCWLCITLEYLWSHYSFVYLYDYDNQRRSLLRSVNSWDPLWYKPLHFSLYRFITRHGQIGVNCSLFLVLTERSCEPRESP